MPAGAVVSWISAPPEHACHRTHKTDSIVLLTTYYGHVPWYWSCQRLHLKNYYEVTGSFFDVMWPFWTPCPISVSVLQSSFGHTLLNPASIAVGVCCQDELMGSDTGKSFEYLYVLLLLSWFLFAHYNHFSYICCMGQTQSPCSYDSSCCCRAFTLVSAPSVRPGETSSWLLKGGGKPMKQIFDTRLWKSLLKHMRRWYLLAGRMEDAPKIS